MNEHPAEAIVGARSGDPFAYLGPHADANGWTIRTFAPHASAVEIVDERGEALARATRIHVAGLFEAQLPLPVRSYRLRLTDGAEPQSAGARVIEDPYRFPSALGDIDNYLLREGTHQYLYDKLGARPMELDGIAGVHFALWAPNASRVSVVGPFNDWDGRRHPMRFHPDSGTWDLFMPHLGAGEFYKFELLDAAGVLQPLKSDPFARRMEAPPGNASIVHQDSYQWRDDAWMRHRHVKTTIDQPVSIYEVHLGSWRREDGRWLTYRELAQTLVPYVRDMGYTHIELLPVSEHPFDGSWGYQPIGLFAPTWRFGDPEDFKVFVDACHQADIGVVIDWVPAHFPRDDFGLRAFDGTHLYEHANPAQGAHPDWGTLVFNFGRAEVVNYLIASAVFWITHYHVDALRVDAVASMLYLDYSRKEGEWVPNRYGGNENLEAVAFLQRMNIAVHRAGGVTLAEESTAWPGVSRPVEADGLGFSYKWNMGWMHDTLAFFQQDPVHRRYHHDKVTFGLTYAFSENFVLALSHDEVVHGKGSMLDRMPGDTWQKFANLRLYYTFMYGHPGKKLQFMGLEFGQGREWDHNAQLDWHLLDVSWHAGVQALVRDLNRLYAATPALFEVDMHHTGFEWIDHSDREQSVIAFARRAKDPSQFVVVVCNMTPVVRENFRLGMPRAGRYHECLNSDAELYGGANVTNPGALATEQVAAHGREHSLVLTLPPLGALILAPDAPAVDAPAVAT